MKPYSLLFLSLLLVGNGFAQSKCDPPNVRHKDNATGWESCGPKASGDGTGTVTSDSGPHDCGGICNAPLVGKVEQIPAVGLFTTSGTATDTAPLSIPLAVSTDGGNYMYVISDGKSGSALVTYTPTITPQDVLTAPLASKPPKLKEPPDVLAISHRGFAVNDYHECPSDYTVGMPTLDGYIWYCEPLKKWTCADENRALLIAENGKQAWCHLPQTN